MAKRLITRAAPSAMAALLSVIATYALLRAYHVLLTSEANPATVVASAKIAMFWRLGIGGYVAGMVAAAVFFATSRQPRLTVKVVAWAIPIVAGMIAAQGLLLP